MPVIRQRPATPRLDRRHPLAAGLITYLLPGVGELISMAGGSPVGSPTFGSSPLGSAVTTPTLTDGYRVPPPRSLTSLVGKTTVTVAFWAQYTALVSDFYVPFNFPYFSTNIAPYFMVGFLTYGGDPTALGLCWNIGTGDFQNSANNGYSNAGYLLTDNQLHCYLATRSGTTISYYRDGTIWGAPLTGMDGTAFTQPATLQPVVFGTRNATDPGEGVAGSYLQGMFWNRALSAPEISQLASQPFGLLRPARRRRPFVRDTTPPSVPANLHTTAVRATAADLAWNAVGDAVSYDLLIVPEG